MLVFSFLLAVEVWFLVGIVVSIVHLVVGVCSSYSRVRREVDTSRKLLILFGAG